MKKILNRKNILKEAGVLLIAAIMILSVVSITANTDEDDNIDLVDLAQLLSNYGMIYETAYEDGDLDGDEDVDKEDLTILLANYNTDQVSNNDYKNINTAGRDDAPGTAHLVEVDNSDAAGLTDLDVNVTEWAAAGYLTYDLVVNVSDGYDWTATGCTAALTNAVFWEHPSGSNLAPNPSSFEFFGLLKYDSFWTCPKDFPNSQTTGSATFAPGSPSVLNDTHRIAEWYQNPPYDVDGGNYTIARYTFLGTEPITLTAEGVIYFAQTGGTEWPFYLTATISGEPNNPPYPPSDPNPEHGAIDVPVDGDLSWIGGDPDPGDTVTYDVYFGTSSPPPKVSENQSLTLYDPGTMSYSTKYYWQIVAWDNHNMSNTGDVWEFTTEGSVPDLECDGSLSWTDVKPGDTVEGSFTVENNGDPTSELNWAIDSYPDWGTWTFTPSSGEDLTPEDGEVTVEVFVVAPDEPETEFTGEVKIVNTDNLDDYCIIDISLTTPMNQHSILTRIIQFLENFINHFPLLERMLERLSALCSI